MAARLIAEHPDWSCKRLAREWCQCWEWRNDRGRLKDFAARSYLLKLEARGLIELPALQVHQGRPPRPVKRLLAWREPSVWEAPLGQLRPVKLERILTGTTAAQRWAFYLDRYHYL